jgi:hypothetical protein
MREGDLTEERTVLARDGQVTVQGLLTATGFLLGWTLHRANPNRTDVDREVMTVIWFADGVLAAGSPNPLVGVA